MYPFEKEEAVRSTKIECISLCQVSPHSGVEAKRNEKRMVILMILFVHMESDNNWTARQLMDGHEKLRRS